MTDTDDLLYSCEDGIARITLNRPDAANALTPDQRNHLIELFEAASGDLNVRVVVLTANGKCMPPPLVAPKRLSSSKRSDDESPAPAPSLPVPLPRAPEPSLPPKPSP